MGAAQHAAVGRVATKRHQHPVQQPNDDVFFKQLQCYEKLMAMGFDESLSFKAAQIHSNVADAIEFLESHKPKTDITEQKSPQIHVHKETDIDYKVKFEQLQFAHNKLKKEFNEQKTIILQLRTENDKYRQKLTNLLTQSIERKPIIAIGDDENETENIIQLSDEKKNENNIQQWFGSNSSVTECDGICKSCYSINRVGAILSEYKINNNLIDKYFEDDAINYGAELLYNDYHHILFKHHDELQQIIDYFCHNYVKCNNLRDCKPLLRNFRDRRDSKRNKIYDADDENVVYLHKQIDVIHCYLFHSFDLNYRLTEKEKEMIYRLSDNKSDENSNYELQSDVIHTNYSDPTFQKLQQLIRTKKTKLREIAGLDRFTNNKFVSQVVQTDNKNDTNDEEEKAAKTHQITAGEHVCAQNNIQYSFGYKYKYWTRYKENRWYIPPKYQDLKREILENKFVDVPLEEYDDEVKKAEDYLNSDYGKQRECYYLIGDEVKQQDTGIMLGAPMTIEAVLSMRFYCCFDELSAKFSDTFRKLPGESDKELIARNSAFHHWSRHLYEAIHIFGDDVVDETFGNVVYHGINKPMVFGSVIGWMYGPLSTTGRMQVAVTFSNGYGLVLQLNKLHDAPHFYSFFDCRAVSDFPAEDERLFLHIQLRIESITHVPLGQTYVWECKAMDILNNILDDQAVINKDIVSGKFIEYYEAMANKEYSLYPQYVNQLFGNIAVQIKAININLWLMNQNKFQYKNYGHKSVKYGYKKVKPFFIGDKNNWLYIDKLCKLFGNVITIKYYNYIQSNPDDAKTDDVKTDTDTDTDTDNESQNYTKQRTLSVVLNDDILAQLLSFKVTSQNLRQILIFDPDESTMTIEQLIQKFNHKTKNDRVKLLKLESRMKQISTTQKQCKTLCISTNIDQCNLIEICQYGHYDALLNLLRLYPSYDVNEKREEDGATALYVACKEGNTKFVATLLSTDHINVNVATTTEGRTPLLIASLYGHIEIVKLLIKQSIKMTLKDFEGLSALSAAKNNHHLNVYELLAEHWPKGGKLSKLETLAVDQIVAIDFGSFGFSAAFCLADAPDHQRIVQDWSDSRASVELQKNLAALLIDKTTKEAVAFGYVAEERYAKAKEKKQQDKYMYFQYFKPYLYSKDHLKGGIEIKASDGVSSLPLSVLITKSFECIIQHSLRFINSFNKLAGIDDIGKDRIYWVVTAPVLIIRNRSSVQIMKKAMEAAGMKHFEIISEAVAAACYFAKNESGIKRQELLVLDCGACTVDAAVVDIENNFVSPTTYCDGMLHGSLAIGDKFMSLLTDLIPSNIIEHIRERQPMQWIKQRKEFEMSKMSLPLKLESEYWNVPFCYAIQRSLVKLKKKRRNDPMYKEIKKKIEGYQVANIENKEKEMSAFKLGRAVLKINKNGWLFLHQEILDKITSFLQNVLNETACIDCDSILVTGGFARSQYLISRLKKDFPNKVFYSPRQPHLAVIRGALYRVCTPTNDETKPGIKSY